MLAIENRGQQIAFASSDKKLLFLANQKCASTSVSRVIGPDCNISPKKSGIITHNSFEQANRILSRLNNDPSVFTSFTCIRNPWPRVVSFYRHIHSEVSRNPFWARIAELQLSFEKFLSLEEVQDELSQLAANRFAYDESSDRWVSNVFLMEDMHETLPAFLADFGIVFDQMPHARDRGGSRAYQEWYNDSSKGIVGKLFSADIEIGGYIFDPHD